MDYAGARAVVDVFSLLQQNPIVVDLSTQPPPARDISIDVVLGMFAMAGVFLLAAAVGSLIVAGSVILYRKRRDDGPAGGGSSHTRLRI